MGKLTDTSLFSLFIILFSELFESEFSIIWRSLREESLAATWSDQLLTSVGVSVVQYFSLFVCNFLFEEILNFPLVRTLFNRTFWGPGSSATFEMPEKPL